jgi:hypothetical protein
MSRGAIYRQTSNRYNKLPNSKKLKRMQRQSLEIEKVD